MLHMIAFCLYYVVYVNSCYHEKVWDLNLKNGKYLILKGIRL